MAIGKGSMARAAKAVKNEAAVATEKKAVEKKPEEKMTEAVNVDEKAATKKATKNSVKTPAAKKAPAKRIPAKTPAKAAVVTPSKQVLDMIKKDRYEVGDEMPIYFY